MSASSLLSKALCPRGPIINHQVSKRADWSCGRCFDAEERRVGILTSIREQLPLQNKNNSNKKIFVVGDDNKNNNENKEVIVAPARRLSCVIKGEPTDWQSNSVTRSGEFLTLQSRPKARWKKIAPAEFINLEQDKRDWADPMKEFRPHYIHLGKYVRVMGKCPADTLMLNFAMYSENYSLRKILRRLFYRSKIDSAGLSFHGDYNVGAFGCHSSLGTGIGVSKDRLLHSSKHYNIRALLFNPLEYSGQMDPANARGTYHRCLLRHVSANSPEEIESVLAEHILQRGFINYFPLQVFTVCSNSLHELYALGSSDNNNDGGGVAAAIGLFLQSEAERNPLAYQYFIELLSNMQQGEGGGGIVKSIFQQWADDQREKEPELKRLLHQVLAIISEENNNPKSVVGIEERKNNWRSQIWENGVMPQQEYMFSSAQAFLWNAIASQRIFSYGCLTPVEGDVVRIPLSSQKVTRGTFEHEMDMVDALSTCDPRIADEARWEYRLVKKGEEKKYHISDVVLPIPGVAPPSSNKGPVLFPATAQVHESLYRQFASVHSLSSVMSATNPTGDRLVSPYRPLISFPQGLSYKIMEDPNSYSSLKSDLFLMQERKPVTFGLRHTRIREPSPYNQSPVFREHIEKVIQYQGSSSAASLLRSSSKDKHYSVALSYFLPWGSSSEMMLREGFEVKQMNFLDLMHPQLISN